MIWALWYYAMCSQVCIRLSAIPMTMNLLGCHKRIWWAPIGANHQALQHKLDIRRYTTAAILLITSPNNSSKKRAKRRISLDWVISRLNNESGAIFTDWLSCQFAPIVNFSWGILDMLRIYMLIYINVTNEAACTDTILLLLNLHFLVNSAPAPRWTSQICSPVSHRLAVSSLSLIFVSD